MFMPLIKQRIVRKLLCFIPCCVFSVFWNINGFAQPVSVETARMAAVNWIKQHGGVESTSVAQMLPVADKALRNSNPAYYTFTMDKGGWVIVAGDDVAYPVIGYALQGSVSEADMPVAFRAWMEEVEKEIRAATRKNQSSFIVDRVAATNSSAWDMLTRSIDRDRPVKTMSISPLLRTTWSQWRYYNTQCPYDATSDFDNHALVGCVATAMGQVMKYHNWPVTGVGSQSYYHPTYGTLSADFGTTHYDWDSMPSGSVTAYNPAVSTLLYHAGVSVEMDYGPDGSGAYTSAVAIALKTNFRYKNSATYEHRSSYTTSSWEEKIRNELNARRPLVYRGSGTGGHAFVCDGYNGTDYFHFNWGWNGWYDGYFYLSSLTPDGYNFSNYQGAIFGIEPDGKPEPVQQKNMNSVYHLLLGK